MRGARVKPVGSAGPLTFFYATQVAPGAAPFLLFVIATNFFRPQYKNIHSPFHCGTAFGYEAAGCAGAKPCGPKTVGNRCEDIRQTAKAVARNEQRSGRRPRAAAKKTKNSVRRVKVHKLLAERLARKLAPSVAPGKYYPIHRHLIHRGEITHWKLFFLGKATVLLGE